jgi:hypothetical protein
VAFGGNFLEAKSSKAEGAYSSISRLRTLGAFVIWCIDSEAVTGAFDALGMVKGHISYR